jgi:flagellar assembly protein FliH
MSNVVIPKEQLTAFQRWELASFDRPTVIPQANEAQAKLQTAAELANIQQRAHDEGYAVGHQAGYTAGIQQAVNTTTQINQLMQTLQDALNQMDEQLAQSLLELSLEVAKKMVLVTIENKPEIIIKIVSEAIRSLPHFNQNAHLIMHPQDAELVREQMGEQLIHAGWKIFTDNQIQRGGCRVETAHSHIDATNEARWHRIVESIGQDKSWQT